MFVYYVVIESLFRRLHNDRPADKIVTGASGFIEQGWQVIDSEQQRKIEGKCQGFRDRAQAHFKYTGSRACSGVEDFQTEGFFAKTGALHEKFAEKEIRPKHESKYVQ